MNLRLEIDRRVAAAMAAAGVPADLPAMVAPAKSAQFGDYQANGAMGAAKAMRLNPRQLAQKVLEQLQPGGAGDLSDLAETIEIAGPGFLNITLKQEFLSAALTALTGDRRLGVAPPTTAQTVVVDYSGPNLAKEMHVGHLRSTIIGDALARTLEFLGHRVVRQNHVGDWGTQFGMLIAYLKDLAFQDPEGFSADSQLADLEEFYRKAKARFDAEPAFADAAREEVVLLQRGETETYDMWTKFVEVSLQHCEAVYRRLGVGLTRDDLRPESSYNDDLPKVIADLATRGLLQESQGAQCVFLEQFKNKDGEVLPLIVQKSDEGYLYATTDLAAIRHRAGVLHADRALYVTDSRQALHFQQVFAVARAAGFAPPSLALEHVAFGTMLGNDGKPFKTRTGGTVKLMELLDEAVERAQTLVDQKNPDLPAEQRRHIAQTVGIGAVKYADLSQNRTTDYLFSWDKMLSLQGNTAPYMQYAYARIQSIFRKGAEETSRAREEAGEATSRDRQGAGTIFVSQPAERALAVKLLQMPEIVAAVAQECLPNVLCAYLYDLAGAFTGFYESCPVLKSEPAVRASRLALCRLTAGAIRQGLSLLGIEVIEQM